MQVWLRRFLLLLILVLLAGPLAAAATGLADVRNDWRTASRESAGIAPDPAAAPEAIIQVYGARAFGWRAAFAVHTWISAKRAGTPGYTVYQVVGWRYWQSGHAVSVQQDIPDRRWYGAMPELYLDLRGAQAEALIGRIEAAVERYPYDGLYRTWPGPNSNTFTAFVARAVPELGLELPPTAVGKDYLGGSTFAAPSPSGSGYQVSLFGLLGILAAAEEGLEINLLGLTFGLDPLDLAVKLPGLGRLPGHNTTPPAGLAEADTP